MVTKKEALEIFDRLGQAIKNCENIVEEILDKRAWEGLGYTSFAKAYEELLGDVPIRRKHLRNRIVQLLAVDQELTDIGEARTFDRELGEYCGRGWKRFSPTVAGNLISDAREQIAAGVPAEEVIVDRIGSLPTSREKYGELFGGKPYQKVKRKSTWASPPSPPKSIHIDVGPEAYEQYERLAKARGSSLQEEAKKALSIHFSRIERESTLSV